MVQSHSQIRRNTVVIALAAAASIAASLAGYYAAEAEKYYHLSDAALTTAVHFEHQADLQAREDEELLIQATIEYRKNETRIGDLLASQVSQEAKNNIIFNQQNSTLSLMPKYYDIMYSDFLNTTKTEQKYLETAELSNEYSRQFIIATSLLTATIVILSELTRRKENSPLA